MALLDMVKKNLGQPAQAPELGAQEQLRTLAQASTGKASTGLSSTPKASNLGEQMAAQQTQVQSRIQAIQQQDIAAQLGQAEQVQKQQQQMQQRQLSQQEIQMKTQAYQRLGSILDNFEQNKERLTLGQEKASVEQAGFLLRLSNDKYIDKLRIEGRKNRLNTQLAMKEALLQATMIEERALLENDLSFKRLMNAQRREFREELANIDLDRWMEMIEMDASAANAAMKAQALGGIVSTAAGAGSQYLAKNSSTTTTASVRSEETEGNDGTGIDASMYGGVQV